MDGDVDGDRDRERDRERDGDGDRDGDREAGRGVVNVSSPVGLPAVIGLSSRQVSMKNRGRCLLFGVISSTYHRCIWEFVGVKTDNLRPVCTGGWA